MKRIVSLLSTCLVLGLTWGACSLVGCGSKAEEAQKEEKDVGVGDFVDYATGKAPIEKGEDLKKQIRGIQREQNRRLEEAIGE